jgi:cytidylate kinase
MMSSLSSIAFLFVALVTISSDVVTAAAERKLIRRPDSEHELPPIVHRKLEEKVETFFTRSYTAVTSPKDITVVVPPNAQSKLYTKTE